MGENSDHTLKNTVFFLRFRLSVGRFVSTEWDFAYVRHYAASRKVTGSSPDEVDFF
jgi:hypothetical protein